MGIYQQSVLTNRSNDKKNLQRCFAAYGLPKRLHSDNGGALTSSTFDEYMTSNCIKHTTRAAYSPKTNGLADVTRQDTVLNRSVSEQMIID